MPRTNDMEREMNEQSGLTLHVAKALQGSEQAERGWTWDDCSNIEIDGWMDLARAAIAALSAPPDAGSGVDALPPLPPAKYMGYDQDSVRSFSVQGFTAEDMKLYALKALAARPPACETCNGHGLVGGPSYYAPDEGGEPCPDCSIAARQPVGVEPVAEHHVIPLAREVLAAQCRARLEFASERDIKTGRNDSNWPELEIIAHALRHPHYIERPEGGSPWKRADTAPPAPAAVPVDQFRDADHLAEWLGSLVAACGQEEWDAAQAAMNGIRAFQNHPDAVERLRAAIEGECDGLAISGQQASAILAHVMLPEPDGFFATHPRTAAREAMHRWGQHKNGKVYQGQYGHWWARPLYTWGESFTHRGDLT